MAAAAVAIIVATWGRCDRQQRVEAWLVDGNSSLAKSSESETNRPKGSGYDSADCNNSDRAEDASITTGVVVAKRTKKILVEHRAKSASVMDLVVHHVECIIHYYGYSALGA
jgi:hypothetical protein